MNTKEESKLNNKVKPVVVLNNYSLGYLNKIILTYFDNEADYSFKFDNFDFKCPIIISLLPFEYGSVFVSSNKQQKFCTTSREMNEFLRLTMSEYITPTPITISIKSPLIINEIKLIQMPILINELETSSLTNSLINDSFFSIHLNKEKTSFILDKNNFTNNKISFVDFKDNNYLNYYYNYLLDLTEKFYQAYKNKLLTEYQLKIIKLLDIEKHWKNLLNNVGIFLKKQNKIKIIKTNDSYQIKYQKIPILMDYYDYYYCHNNELNKYLIMNFVDYYSNYYNQFNPQLEDNINETNIHQYKKKLIKEYHLFVDNLVIKTQNDFDRITLRHESLRERCYTHYYYTIEAYKGRIKNLINE